MLGPASKACSTARGKSSFAGIRRDTGRKTWPSGKYSVTTVAFCHGHHLAEPPVAFAGDRPLTQNPAPRRAATRKTRRSKGERPRLPNRNFINAFTQTSSCHAQSDPEHERK